MDVVNILAKRPNRTAHSSVKNSRIYNFTSCEGNNSGPVDLILEFRKEVIDDPEREA